MMTLLRRHYGKLAAVLLLGLALAVLWWALPVQHSASSTAVVSPFPAPTLHGMLRE